MHTKIEISRGDEIQFIISKYEKIPYILRILRFYLRPFKIRLGIGYGEIDNYLNNISSWDMNGIAMQRARKAIDIINEDKKLKRKTYFLLDKKEEKQINSLYLLMDIIIDRWTDKNWEVINLYEASFNMEEIAKKLFITKGAVSSRINTEEWY